MKLSKKLIIIITTVLVLIIGGGVAYATNTPTARADRELKLANKYLQDGKYQEAILAFQKVIEIEPKNIPARLGLGKVYVATKEFTKAETVLKEVIQIDANNIPAREDLLKVYLKESNLNSANTILQEMVKIDPNKDVKQFNSDLESAKAINASKVCYDQGVQQMNGKLYLESMTSFQKVIKEDTERYADAQQKIKDAKPAYIAQQLQTATDLVTATKYDEAIKVLDELLKIDAINADAIKLKDQCNQALAKVKADADAKSALAKAEGSKITTREQALQKVLDYNYHPGNYRLSEGKDKDSYKLDYKYLGEKGSATVFIDGDGQHRDEVNLHSGGKIFINNAFRIWGLNRGGGWFIDGSNGKLYIYYNDPDNNFKPNCTLIE